MTLARYGDRIYTFLNDGRAVTGIREKDVNVAYELPDIAVANAAKPRPKSVEIPKSVDTPKPVGFDPRVSFHSKPAESVAPTSTPTTPTTPTSNTTPSTPTTDTPTSNTTTTTKTDTTSTNDTTKQSTEEEDDTESIMRLHLMFRRANPVNQTQQSTYMRSSPMVLFHFLIFIFVYLHVYRRFCLEFQ